NGNLASQNEFSQAPLWQQARDILIIPSSKFFKYANTFFEPADFVRFRELSLTYSVSPRMARALHLHTCSLTAAVRNLALWTRYTGVDPEVSRPEGGIVNSGLPGPSSVTNDNDLRVDGEGSVPLPREWFARITLGL